jgi:hypothetical protein
MSGSLNLLAGIAGSILQENGRESIAGVFHNLPLYSEIRKSSNYGVFRPAEAAPLGAVELGAGRAGPALSQSELS